MEASQTDSLHDELLASLKASGATTAPDAYRIERILKESDFEKTQLVYIRTLDGGELGPYVRKLINKEKGLGGTYRLLMDAQARGKRLQHVPRIVRLNEGEETLEVVMEYVGGPSVREIAEVGSLGNGPALASRLMPAVCDAVLDLHEQLGSPVIHRDLTPNNIICPEGNVQNPVLIDFAISRAWSADAQSDTTHFGTRAYAPPEQFGFGQTDVRSDVYALGMLAFFCLTGRDPYPADRTVGFRDPAVPEVWRKVIEKACELDPVKRYENVRQLRLACEEAVSEFGANAPATREDAANRRNTDASIAREGFPAIPPREKDAGDPPRHSAQCGLNAHDDNVVGNYEEDVWRTAGNDAAEATPLASFDAQPAQLQPTAEPLRSASGTPGTNATTPESRSVSGTRPAQRPAPRFFTVWNDIVLATVAICIAACVYDFVDPSLRIQGSFATNLFGYLVWLPCAFLIAGFILLDKRWLYANVAWFKRRTRLRMWRDIILAYAAITTVWFAIIAICG